MRLKMSLMNQVCSSRNIMTAGAVFFLAFSKYFLQISQRNAGIIRTTHTHRHTHTHTHSFLFIEDEGNCKRSAHHDEVCLVPAAVISGVVCPQD